MWIEKLKNGKFKFCERYQDPMTMESKRVSVTLDKDDRKTTKLAETILNEKIDKLLSASDYSDSTFSELVTKYVSYQKENVRESTYKRDKGQCNILVNIIGPKTLVSKLSARYVREQLDKSGKANVTKNTYLKRYKAIIHWGYRNDYVEDISYLEKLVPYEDRRQSEKIEDKYLEHDEMEKLLASIDKSRCYLWRDLTRFLLLSGLRIGEAAALTKKDIDKELIHITKTYSYTTYQIGPPKTPESYRDVFIQKELADLIKQVKIRNKKSKVSSSLLFSENGNYIDYDNYRMFLRRHAEKSIGRVITPHALRHTHASLLLAKGISIDAISRRLGHKDSKVTREIYLHILEELKQRDNNALRDLNII